MQRIYAGLAAGGLTALVLVAALATGFVPDTQAEASGAAAEVAPPASATVADATATPMLASTPTVNAQELMEQNRQLTQALEMMQAREAQYRQQIEAANQALLAAQQQLEQQAAQAAAYRDNEQEGWNAGEAQGRASYARGEHEGHDEEH
jgi:hypothetical protein